MKLLKHFAILFTIFFDNQFLFSQSNIDHAWNNFFSNKRDLSEEEFTAIAAKDNKNEEAILGLCLLSWYKNNPEKSFEYLQKYYSIAKSPMPVLYSLWSTKAFNNNSSKTDADNKIKFLEKLLEDTKINPTIKAMAYQQLGEYSLDKNQFAKAEENFKKIGALENWQILGVFDNTSGNGYDKDFGALAHPESDHKFTGINNYTINWFTPPAERSDRWFDFTYYFLIKNKVMYAQTFVESDIKQEIYIKAGCSGSMKIWVNDFLVLNESEERNCDLDLYTSRIKLNKGSNRILVQIGESDVNRANFLIRLTDIYGENIPNLKNSSNFKPYTKENTYTLEGHKLFAETYFEKKIFEGPTKIINYLLLAETYLRNDKYFEAKKYLTDARKLAPNSTFISLLLIDAHVRAKNNNIASIENDFIKKNDPDCPEGLAIKYVEYKEINDIDNAEKTLETLEKLYGKSKTTHFTRINLANIKKDYNALLKLAEEAYELFPDDEEAVVMKYSIENDINKNQTKSLEILEKYLKTNFSSNIIDKYGKHLLENGSKEKAFEIYKKRINDIPYGSGYLSALAENYISLVDYESALVYRKKTLEFTPYVGYQWQKLGENYKLLNRDKEAIEAFNKAINLNPQLTEARSELNKLLKKDNPFDVFKKYDSEKILSQKDYKKEYPNEESVILLDLTQKIIYKESASETKFEMIVKILEQPGIDTWKEFNIGTDSNYETISLEKAEIVKSNGARSKAEFSEGKIVFTGLEVNDAIHVIYKKSEVNYGSLFGAFSARNSFSMSQPIVLSEFNLLIPNSIKFEQKTLNSTIKPIISKKENQALYTWRLENTPSFEGESFAPVSSDLQPLLEISTFPNWGFIQQWYSDISSSKTKVDFEVKEVVDELFKSKPKNLDNYEKAKIIYYYIQKNINYLNVSFLQNGIVPQKASKTLSTKLGDCKDLSVLFMAMCKAVGFDANLVLVLTKDFGQQAILLPSINFNHCIASFRHIGKEYFIELTDPNLAFCTVPSVINGAQALRIPYEGKLAEGSLFNISAINKKQDIISRKTKIRVIAKDMAVNTTTIKTANLAAYYRQSHESLSQEELEKEMSEAIAADYSNPVKFGKLKVINTNFDSDSIQYIHDYQVNNEISEVAGINIFRLPWSEKIGSLDFVSADTRKYSFELWSSFNSDFSIEEIEIILPKGKKIIEKPNNIILSDQFVDYSMVFTATPTGFIAKRAIKLKAERVEPNNYPKFKEFFTKVVNQDNMQFAYK